MSSYEAKVWSRDADGNDVLVPVTSWEIGSLMAHHEDCRIRVELRRSAHTGESQERRLELATVTACTCGRREEMERATEALAKPAGVDRRDNRDPAEVGREYIGRLRPDPFAK